MQRELWRIQDVLAGLSGRRENYRLTIDWLHNPGGSLASTICPPITRFNDRPSLLPPERTMVLSGPAPKIPSSSTLSKVVPSPTQWVSVPKVPPTALQLLFLLEIVTTSRFLSRWRTLPRPDHRCHASMILRRRPQWSRPSLGKPQWAATPRCGG